MKKFVCCVVHMISLLSGASIYASAHCSSDASDYFKKNLKAQARTQCAFCKKESLVVPCLECAKQYSLKSVFRIEADSDGKPELVRHFHPGIAIVSYDAEFSRDYEFDSLMDVTEFHIQGWAEKYLTNQKVACDLSQFSFRYPDRELYIQLMRAKNDKMQRIEKQEEENAMHNLALEKEYAQTQATQAGKEYLAQQEKMEKERHEITDESHDQELERRKKLVKGAQKKLDKILELKIKLERRAAIAKWKKAIASLDSVARDQTASTTVEFRNSPPAKMSKERNRSTTHAPRSSGSKGTIRRSPLKVNLPIASPLAGLPHFSLETDQSTYRSVGSPSMGPQTAPVDRTASYVPSPTHNAAASPTNNSGAKPGNNITALPVSVKGSSQPTLGQGRSIFVPGTGKKLDNGLPRITTHPTQETIAAGSNCGCVIA